jgi:GTPase SAR1 family protein
MVEKYSIIDTPEDDSVMIRTNKIISYSSAYTRCYEDKDKTEVNEFGERKYQ